VFHSVRNIAVLYHVWIIRAIKWWRERWAKYLARIAKWDSYRFLIGKLVEVCRSVGTSGRRWEDTELGLNKGCVDVNRIHLAQDKAQWLAVTKTQMNFVFQGGNFFFVGQLSDRRLRTIQLHGVIYSSVYWWEFFRHWKVNKNRTPIERILVPQNYHWLNFSSSYLAFTWLVWN
jgi:hypothetical protein